MARSIPLFSRLCTFVAGATDANSLPPSRIPEIAFVGRSNVGKSSLINALVGRRGLARTSITPGRTRQINLFTIDKVLMLADLPGYGYSKAARSEVREWMGMVHDYLTGRASLMRALLLIDARRGVKEIDEDAMHYLDGTAVSYQLVLTKSDAIKPTALAEVVAAAQASLALHAGAYPQIIATSSRTGDGIGKLRAEIEQLLSGKKA